MTTEDLIRECAERAASHEAGYDKQLLMDAASALKTLSALVDGTITYVPRPLAGTATGWSVQGAIVKGAAGMPDIPRTMTMGTSVIGEPEMGS